MKLNCDLGEGAGIEEAVMAFIDQASIACGVHAGDLDLIGQTMVLAQQHGVSIGAHPGYPDREHFGRVSMNLSPEEINILVTQQVEVLAQMGAVDYVKPHGALYHDMMAKNEVRRAIFSAMDQGPASLALMIQATPEIESHRAEASQAGMELWPEAFADRRYDNSGHLLPRHMAGAILDRSQMLEQVQQLLTEGSVTTDTGNKLGVTANTLCVHGDNEEGVQGIREIRKLLSNG